MTLRNDSLFKASLITLILMILGMVVIGGITRLTGSGLSIVEWKPVTGILPPFTLADWTLEFAKYQQSPEFQKINADMTLSEFQSIFWLEYIHRLWGRVIGIVLLIPTGLMIFKKQHRSLWPLIGLLWILGGAQGLMGWLMVKSGLIHDPHVSPYRLALHLLLGFAIFGVGLWTVFILYIEKARLSSLRRQGSRHFLDSRFRGNDRRSESSKRLKTLTSLTIAMVLGTAFMGGLVAGHKAGLVYNTFPYMGEGLVPYEFLKTTPWWKDLLENPVSVQFLHRLMAITTALLCGFLWLYQRNFNLPNPLPIVYTSVALAALIQVTLGIATLLGSVPLSLAVLHQAFAFILFGLLLYTLFLLRTYNP